MIRVLIVDDHPVVRDGLTAVLATQPDLQPVGTADTGTTALREVAIHNPDVVLMDLQLPEMDGVAATAAIRERHPQVRMLVLTGFDTDADILAAIRAAARGDSALSPAVAAKVLHRIRGNHGPGLSSREIDVLTAAACGHSNKQIAKNLHISEATVKTHLLHIYTKLGVDGRTAAVTTALDHGIIRLS